MAPTIMVNRMRGSSGSDDFQASATAMAHCTAKTPRNVRCVPWVSVATTS